MTRRVLFPIALSTACSFVFVEGPPRDHERRVRVECTENRAAPVLDMLVAGYLLGAAFGFAVQSDFERENSNDVGLLATHAGLGALMAASAAVGLVRTGRCREARGLLVARQEAGPAPPSGAVDETQQQAEAAGEGRGGWEGLSLEATAGGYYGLGGGLRLEAGRAGLHFGAGWQPIFLGVSTFPVIPFYTPTGTSPATDYLSAVEVNADLHFLLHRATRFSEIGFTAGYRYSTVLHHGGAFGVYAELNRGQPWGLFGAVGASFYPEGENRVKEEHGYPRDVNLVPDVLAGLSLGLSFNP
jgi:hypothetical protein